MRALGTCWPFVLSGAKLSKVSRFSKSAAPPARRCTMKPALPGEGEGSGEG